MNNLKKLPKLTIINY